VWRDLGSETTAKVRGCPAPPPRAAVLGRLQSGAWMECCSRRAGFTLLPEKHVSDLIAREYQLYLATWCSHVGRGGKEVHKEKANSFYLYLMVSVGWISGRSPAEEGLFPRLPLQLSFHELFSLCS